MYQVIKATSKEVRGTFELRADAEEQVRLFVETEGAAEDAYAITECSGAGEGDYVVEDPRLLLNPGTEGLT